MIELGILIVIVATILLYKKTLQNIAKGTSAQADAWAKTTEADAVTKVSEIQIEEETVTTANEKLKLLNTVKWHK